MSVTTHIGWCDSTWNWVRGCRKVSEGCNFCYITRRGLASHGGERVVAADATFNAPLRWNKRPWVCSRGHGPYSSDAIGLTCPECGNTFHRRRVFSLSLGDWLDPEIPISVLVRALDIIRRCEAINFLLLTKRPQLWRERVSEACDTLHSLNPQQEPLKTWLWHWLGEPFLPGQTPPGNVWIGTSVENQKRTDERIPELLQIPARVRFLSAEPLLESVQFKLDGIGQVIAGGESGPNARPCNIEWIRSIKQQCETAGVPVFVKQLGARPVEDISDARGKYTGFKRVDGISHPKGGDPSEWPEDLRDQEFPES